MKAFTSKTQSKIQAELPEQRDYLANPRAAHERDPDHRGDLRFTDEDYEQCPTKQSEAEACDINNIMARYQATGLLPEIQRREPSFGDFSTMETLQEAMAIVAQANSQFAALPSAVREKFANNPAEFLKFVDDPKNNDALVEMGLAERPKESADQILKDIRENTKKPAKTPDSSASKE